MHGRRTSATPRVGAGLAVVAVVVVFLALAGACGGAGPHACRFKSVAGQRVQSLAVSVDGGLWAWGGSNMFETSHTRAPYEIRFTHDDVAVLTRNDGLTCEVLADSSRICWPIEGNATRTIDLSKATQVAMSLGVTDCVVRSDGTVGCWDTLTGVPPDPDTLPSPEGLNGAVSAVALGAGWPAHGCAIRTDQSLWCWGVGILGDGTPSQDTPSPAIEIVSLHGVVKKVALGAASTCVVTIGGDVRCWGPIIDAAPPALRPTLVEIPVTFVDVEMGVGHACGLTDDGQVWCWGTNDSLQTSAPNQSDTSPHHVPLAGHLAVQITAGDNHACARGDDGTTWCWGTNHDGQLGDGRVTAAASSMPVEVVGCQ